MQRRVALLMTAFAVVARAQVATQGEPRSVLLSPQLQTLEAALKKSDPGQNSAVVFNEFVGGHELFNWRQKLPEALTYVLGRRP
jgi:enterochelin esterase-like enzyme